LDFNKFLGFEFSKRLPKDLGGERIYVTGRADARVLKPGWDGAAFDLQIVSRRMINSGMTVWDIGANQGILSFMAASRVGATGAVFALEADPAYADLIFRSSQRLSDKYGRVNVLCAAIADRNGFLKFGVSTKGHARNKLLGLGDDEGFSLSSIKTVPAFSGDSLLESWAAPDFIKMDVEGAEVLALTGCDTILRTVRPTFYIEVSRQNEGRATEIFRDYNYDIFKLKGDGSEAHIEECCFYTVARPGRHHLRREPKGT
jgi:FkbM family methyltransferase